jgi:predicted MFS family arabinose efflux permease
MSRPPVPRFQIWRGSGSPPDAARARFGEGILLGDEATKAAIAGTFTMAAALGVDRFVYTPLLPMMQEALRLSSGQVGLIASANFAGYLAGALLASVARMPGGRRAWLLGALATSAGMTIAMSSWPSVPFIAAIRFIGGAAGAFAVVIATAMTVECSTSTGRSGLMALHFAGVGIGIVGSATLVSLLARQGADWREGWVACGILSTSFVAAVVYMTPAQTAVHRTTSAAFPDKVHGSFWRLVAANGLSAFGYVTTATFLVAMVRKMPEVSHLEGWIWIIFGLATGPSILFWNVVVRFTSLPTALGFAYVTEAVGVASSLAESSAIGMVAAAVCVGATFMANTSLGMLAARKLWQGDLRRPVALMTASFGAGQIVGPSLSGYLSDHTGNFVLASLVATCGLLVGALLIASVRQHLVLAD